MLIFLSLLSLLIDPLPRPVRKTTITVEIQNIRSTAGRVRLGLYKPCDGFPEKCKPAQARQLVATGSSVRTTFEVDPGDYALAAYHDVNDNSKLDMRLFIPKEPYGFSNNVRPKLSPPKFADCRIQVGSDAKTVTFRLE